MLSSKITALTLASALCAIAFVGFVSTQEAPAGAELAVDLHTPDGTHLQIPFGQPDRQKLHPELLANVQQDYDELFPAAYSAVDELLINPKGFAMFRYIKTAKSLIGLTMTQHERRKKQKLVAGMSKAYYKRMYLMMKYILSHSVDVEKSLKGTPKDTRALGEEIKALMKNVHIALAASPAGGYIGWDEALVNGRPFPEVVSELVGAARYNGYGTIISLAKVTIDKIWKE